MVRFAWHVAHGRSAQVLKDAVTAHKQSGVIHAVAELEGAADAPCCFTLPPAYTSPDGVSN